MVQKDKYLFGSLADMLLLGGGSILALLFFAMAFEPTQAQYETLMIVFLTLSILINYPHFAQSYMIFYDGYKEKIVSKTLPASLTLRYFVYGIIVPVLMAGYFAYFFINPDPQLLVFSIYAMAFFVGWHYVKQGYGMIILDSVLKKSFFSAPEKKLLLVNAYVSWLSSFALINTLPKTHNMFGLTYQNPLLPYPDVVQYIAIFSVIASSLPVLVMLATKIFTFKNQAPICGIVAYLTSIYVWLFVGQLNPIFLLAIPAFHSLQYSTVVSKYIINKNHTSQPYTALMKFYFCSIILGCLGFWGASYFLTPFYTPVKGLESVDIFIIMTTVFINIHHYFLDNVLWRKENNNVKQYLFKTS